MPTLPRIPRMDTRYQPAWETRAIAEILRQTIPEDVTTYEAMSEAAGGADIQHRKRYFLESAVKILQREGLAFGCVTRIGYKRLSDTGIVHGCESRRTQTLRATTRHQTFLRCASLGSLDIPLQQQAMAYAAMFATIGMMATRQALDFVREHGTLPTPEPLQPHQLKGLFR